LKHSCLADLDREYTLSEIAVITRAGPARILGLKQKGHLGVGADADVCVYEPNSNYQRMFELPQMVIKGGRVLVEDSEIRQTVQGKTLMANPSYDQQRNESIENWFSSHYSLQSEHYGIQSGDAFRRQFEAVDPRQQPGE